MKPLEVWTCQRAENLRRSHRKFKKITTQQKWYRRRADKLSAAAAARRSTKSGGGGAHKLSAAAARRGRRTALSLTSGDPVITTSIGFCSDGCGDRQSNYSAAASKNSHAAILGSHVTFIGTIFRTAWAVEEIYLLMRRGIGVGKGETDEWEESGREEGGSVGKSHMNGEGRGDGGRRVLLRGCS